MPLDSNYTPDGLYIDEADLERLAMSLNQQLGLPEDISPGDLKEISEAAFQASAGAVLMTCYLMSRFTGSSIESAMDTMIIAGPLRAEAVQAVKHILDGSAKIGVEKTSL